MSLWLRRIPASLTSACQTTQLIAWGGLPTSRISQPTSWRKNRPHWQVPPQPYSMEPLSRFLWTLRSCWQPLTQAPLQTAPSKWVPPLTIWPFWSMMWHLLNCRWTSMSQTLPTAATWSELDHIIRKLSGEKLESNSLFWGLGLPSLI